MTDFFNWLAYDILWGTPLIVLMIFTGKSITMTIRLDRELQEEYDELAAKSGRSRNELMCKALRYALDNLKFVDTEARQ